MALIDVVKFNGLNSRDWIVYKHYAEDLSTSTQLIVSEGQVAVFLKGGRVCDIFGPGTYTLSTQNLPLLSALINLPYGRKTPFTAEIYYINTTTKLDLARGTSDPIPLIDPKYNIRLRIRAFGQVGLKISNYQYFVTELIGSMNPSELVSYNKVLDFYKGFLISKVKTQIAQVIIEKGISALEISAHLDEISDKMSVLISKDFEKFGMTLVNFYIKSINFPDDDFDRVNALLEKKAEFEILGDQRYATSRTFDVYEGAAKNENGIAGAFAAGGMGIGAGAAIGSNMSPMQGVMSTPKQNDVYCPKCNAANVAGSKFCNTCGASIEEKEETMICPKCSAQIKKGSKFCNRCGASLAEKKCECGAKLEPGVKFCSNCGRKVED